jgi:hypothetical protein
MAAIIRGKAGAISRRNSARIFLKPEHFIVEHPLVKGYGYLTSLRIAA